MAKKQNIKPLFKALQKAGAFEGDTTLADAFDDISFMPTAQKMLSFFQDNGGEFIPAGEDEMAYFEVLHNPKTHKNKMVIGVPFGISGAVLAHELAHARLAFKASMHQNPNGTSLAQNLTYSLSTKFMRLLLEEADARALSVLGLVEAKAAFEAYTNNYTQAPNFAEWKSGESDPIPILCSETFGFCESVVSAFEAKFNKAVDVFGQQKTPNYQAALQLAREVFDGVLHGAAADFDRGIIEFFGDYCVATYMPRDFSQRVKAPAYTGALFKMAHCASDLSDIGLNANYLKDTSGQAFSEFALATVVQRFSEELWCIGQEVLDKNCPERRRQTLPKRPENRVFSKKLKKL